MQLFDAMLIVLATVLGTLFIVAVGMYIPVLASAMALFGPLAVLHYL